MIYIFPTLYSIQLHLIYQQFYIQMKEDIYAPTTDIYLFINSSSGGGLGQQMLQQQRKEKPFTVKSNQNADCIKTEQVIIHFFNLKSKQENGFQKVKIAIDEGKQIIIVICGGDGTVMWVVTEMNNHQIDPEKAPIAIIPLGTGNDFSQTFGWGKASPTDLLSNDYQKLKKRITYWLNGTRQQLDIWMVEVQVHDYGKIEKVNNGNNKEQEGKKYTKHFCNYFSVGVDGKIGYSFDMHRTTTRVGNLAMYGMLSLVKSFTKTKNIEQLVKSLVQKKEGKQAPQVEIVQLNHSKTAVADKMSSCCNSHIKQSNSILRQQDNNANTPSIQQNILGESSSNIQYSRQSQNCNVILEQSSQKMNQIKSNLNLTFLNINSFMGGTKDIWKHAKINQPSNIINQTSINDGMIEIVSFNGPFSMGMQKVVGGFAEKVYQGSGPFLIQFKKYPQAEKHRTYLEIDGEFVRCTHPKTLTLRKSYLSKTGQITIIKKLEKQNQKKCCGCFQL